MGVGGGFKTQRTATGYSRAGFSWPGGERKTRQEDVTIVLDFILSQLCIERYRARGGVLDSEPNNL